MEFLIQNMKPDNLENTTFAIVLDFTKPWTFMDELSQWADVIFEINKKLFLQLPVSKQNAMRKKIEDHFKFYKNPAKTAEDKATEDGKENEQNEGEGEDDMRDALKDMDLEDGILNVNLGVRIMVICTKSEVVASGDSQKYFQPRFEFILKHLREFCLRYGASLIFTSAKKGTNWELLYNYLFFDADFNHGPEINNKESIFIPAGYDSPKLVELLVPNIDDPYDKIVNNLSAGEQAAEEEEVTWEDWDTWLKSMNVNKDDAAEKAKTKKVDPKNFFQRLRQGADKRESTKAPEAPAEENNAKADEDKDNDKEQKLAEFKKKLMMKDLDS